MAELTEVRLNDDTIVLKNNQVKAPILPSVSRDLERDVQVQGNCILEGAVYARNLSILQGPLRAKGAIFSQVDFHVATDSTGPLFFEKAVASAQSIVSHAPGSRLHFLSDVSAKKIRLRNAYVAASIYADEVVLEDCVVVGGVFASKSLELHDCVVGTFNAPAVRASKAVYLLFPSAFSVERISSLPGTSFYNLTLADLGALMRRQPEAPQTGRILMDVTKDEVRTVLAGQDGQQVVRAYSVVGKVLAADMLDLDKLQNHFLLSCAGLGGQLARTYDLGLGADGQPVQLSPEAIADFFFDVLAGRITVSELDGRFDLAAIIERFGAPAAATTTAAAASPEATPAGEAPQASPPLAGEGPGDSGPPPLPPT